MDMFKEYGITLEEAENFIDTIGKILDENAEKSERYVYYQGLWAIKKFLEKNFEK